MKYLYYYQFRKLFGEGNGRLFCGWLGMVVAWQADLSGRLGATVGAPRLGAF